MSTGLADDIPEPPIPYTTEALPPVLHRLCEQPPMFDGTTRLYMCYKCPYSQRIWMARNYKGLQEKIKLVPINSWNKPTWFRKKILDHMPLPALEHNNEIHINTEDSDLLEYIEKHFPGPSLIPKAPNKKLFCRQMISFADEFTNNIKSTFTSEDPKAEVEDLIGYLEVYCLGKYENGPFFLGEEFTYADIALAPFAYRYNLFMKEQFNYDFFEGRPRFTKWFEEMNKIECYKETTCDPKIVLAAYKSRYITMRW